MIENLIKEVKRVLKNRRFRKAKVNLLGTEVVYQEVRSDQDLKEITNFEWEGAFRVDGEKINYKFVPDSSGEDKGVIWYK